MRKTFIATLIEMAEQDPRILLLTSDLGFMVLEPFQERFPDRFYNVGVAEQNTVGVATGLAEAGFIPFCYSIVTFATLRAYEFIRNGPILQKLPVRIVGTGGGFEYGNAGPTHHGLEDVAVMRTQPGMMVVAPADYGQARSALLATRNTPGPIYLRLGKDDTYVASGLDGRFEPGRAQLIREGSDILLISLGSIIREVEAAADLLRERGLSAGILVVPSFNPDPVADILAELGHYPLALTVEAHYVNGGLGSLVAEIAAEHGCSTRIVRCGVRHSPDGLSGSQDYYFHKHGIDRTGLVETAITCLQEES